MKRYNPWYTFFLLVLVALSMQGCFGIGGNTSSTQNFKQVNTNLKINTSDQALFKGMIYFTQGRNLFVIDGSRNVHQLTSGGDVRDPAISPDGKWIAFIFRHYYASDLDYIPITLSLTTSTHWRVLRSGAGSYVPNGNFPPKATYLWYAQPAWASDSTHLLFLSDIQKEDWYNETGQNAPMLDLQVFSISRTNPSNYQAVAYADFGNGGDRDASYRPGVAHKNEIVYTHYTYDKSRTQQVIQIYLEDATIIASHPNTYYPGTAGSGFDPGIAITPYSTSIENLMPSFSPDGNHLAYIRRIDPSTMGLYVMGVPENVTSNPSNPSVQKNALLPYQQSSLIVKGQYVSQPVWSPDGTQIAYMAYSNNEFDIWLADVTFNAKTGAYSLKGSPVPLTNGGVDSDSRPVWTH